MSDVFISHHEDSAGPLAAQIANALECVGISCWYAPRNIMPGPFRRQIYRAICDCKVFVLLVNPQIEKSSEVLAECEMAYDLYKEDPERISIAPFLVDDCPLPPYLYYFRHFQYIDGSISTLVNQISRILTVEQQALPTKIQSVPPPAKIITRGQCGVNVTYMLNENGTLIISGNGPIGDFNWDNEPKVYNTPWWHERKFICYVIIQDGVTSIGRSAFYGCEALTSVAIPNSVTEINWGAFAVCTELTSVMIPDSVTYIGRYAFYGCKNLTSVSLSKGVTLIENTAFDGCTNLKSISVPAKAYIARDAFPDWVRMERRI